MLHESTRFLLLIGIIAYASMVCNILCFSFCFLLLIYYIPISAFELPIKVFICALNNIHVLLTGLLHHHQVIQCQGVVFV